MMKGSKKPLAAMLDTSVMCRPDNLVMMVMESRADYLVKDNLNAAKPLIDRVGFYIKQVIVRRTSNLKISQESMHPKSNSPRSAASLNPGTFCRAQTLNVHDEEYNLYHC